MAFRQHREKISSTLSVPAYWKKSASCATHSPFSNQILTGIWRVVTFLRDDWFLEELTLKASNGKYGSDCNSWDEPIEYGAPLFLVIQKYLEDFERERVQAAIDAYFAELHESLMFDEGKERAKARSGGYE